MTVFLYATMAALANVLGGALVTARRSRSQTGLNLLVAFGAGFMLGVAFLEMVPHALESAGGMMAVLLGYLAVHLTQHTMTPHFHFGEETHTEAMVSRRVGIWAFVGLLPHSFFDGVAIAAGAMISPELGLLIFLGVVLHKVPTGVTLASIMLASGNSAKRANGAVLVVALATVIGAVLTPVAGLLARYGLGLAAGVTIYVAASNLIPESQHARGSMVPGAVFLGVLVFALTRLLLPHH